MVFDGFGGPRKVHEGRNKRNDYTNESDTPCFLKNKNS